MKVSQVRITHDKIVGPQVTCNKIINLSSLPSEPLRAVLARLPKGPSKYTMVQLLGGAMYDIQTQQMEKKNKTAVNFVVDVDDTRSDIKIKNICKRGSFYISVVITIGDARIKKKKTKTTNKKVPVVGKTTTLANWHHDAEVLTALKAQILMQKFIQGCSSITVIKTNDSLASSVAGILMFLKGMNVECIIEHVTVVYKPTWLTAAPDNANLFKVASTSIADEFLVKNDPYWTYKSGYTSYVMTRKGPKKLTRDPQEEKGNEDIWTWLNGLWSRIVSAVLNIWHMVLQILGLSTTNSQKSEEKIDTSTELAFTFIKEVPELSCIVANAVESFTPRNASKDVKEANKMVARMQMNKMAAKSGPGGDKTYLKDTTSETFNSYLTALTSYNMTEALVMANNSAASRYRYIRSTLIAVIVLVSMIMMTLQGAKLTLGALVVVTIIDYFTDIFKFGLIFNVLALIASPTFLGVTLNMAMLLIELYITDTATKFIRSSIYLIVKCLSYLI